MYIHEAVKEALEKNCCITRYFEKSDQKIFFMIKPLNFGSKVIYPYEENGELKTENWNPSEGELTANNWKTISSEEGLELLKKQLIKEWWEI